MNMNKLKNFGAANNEELKMENLSELKIENGKLKINEKEHPNIFNSQLSIFNSKKRPAFTLAEVLITLVVIGVAAAITIPVLHANTSGKEWNAAKQKARAGMGEAFKLAGVNQDLPDISAKEYVKTVLPKYLKLAKTCDTAQECGFPDKIKTVNGKPVDITGEWKWSTYPGSTLYGANGKASPAVDSWQYSAITPKYNEAAFFQTVDGFSAALMYNPDCNADQFDRPLYYFESDSSRAFAADQMVGQGIYESACFNAVYDMNGTKGPNTVGKDVGFAGSFYTGTSARSAAVLPVEISSSRADWSGASQYCKNLSPAGDYDLPTMDEISLIYLNHKLTAGSVDGRPDYWSRSAVGGKTSYFLDMPLYLGARNNYISGSGYSIFFHCVRADKLM